MLNYGWIIPAIPAVSFILILLFGKHFPKKGSEIGIVALSASFILSCVAVYQWIDRVESASGGHESGLRALGQRQRDATVTDHPAQTQYVSRSAACAPPRPRRHRRPCPWSAG